VNDLASSDVLAIVGRRRVPAMCVVDARGRVVLANADGELLDLATRAVVRNLSANRATSASALGMTEDGNVVRIVPLEGGAEAHFAVFVEPIGTRSPLDHAAKRYGLSGRERQVLADILRGASTAEIAVNLMIAECTVASHVRNIGLKMRASKRKEIVAAILGDP